MPIARNILGPIYWFQCIGSNTLVRHPGDKLSLFAARLAHINPLKQQFLSIYMGPIHALLSNYEKRP